MVIWIIISTLLKDKFEDEVGFYRYFATFQNLFGQKLKIKKVRKKTDGNSR